MYVSFPAFNIRDWYWLVADVAEQTDEVYSSARAAYVPLIDEEFLAWVEQHPEGPTPIPTEADLRDMLTRNFPAGWAKPVEVTPLEFMALFTEGEQAAIAGAAQQNALVLMWMLQLAAARVIDKTDPKTVAGLGALVSAGLLTAERQDAILAV